MTSSPTAMATSFPRVLSLPSRGRKREDPGNEVATMASSCRASARLSMQIQVAVPNGTKIQKAGSFNPSPLVPQCGCELACMSEG